ncbi:MAG: hypothetical protein FD135_1965 [Comamonadaceae bacterium]|nr:MAG: hypothetical protein FD135_1965 [Comamonadaceae bacterium]
MTQTATPNPLPSGNYFEVSILNNTGTHDGPNDQGGVGNGSLYISLVSQTQAYKFEQYINSSQQTVYVATVDTSPGNSVASIALSTLKNEIDNTLGFYVQVFDTAPIALTGGRIYFADQPNQVPYAASQPGGIAPNAAFDFDFVEFTVDAATNQLNLDTTQVDQFGMPIYLQVSPVVSDFKDGTGIVNTHSRAGVIQNFQSATATGPFVAYQGVARQSFDAALYNLFNNYDSSTGGHSLYLVGNGNAGFEIFTGQVIDSFACKDLNGKAGTYTVFQFVGSGYCYDGADATLTSVGSRGGVTYQIFYPYFNNNDANSVNTALSATSDAPYWFGGFSSTADLQFNLPLTSAARMVFGASGVFADNVSQQAYLTRQGSLPAHYDSVMLGNLENQLVTMLNRGVTPNTGSQTNMHLRTGSNTANDLIYADLAKATSTSTPQISYTSSSGALTSFSAGSLSQNANVPSGSSVLWNSVGGTIYFTDPSSSKAITQTFTIDPSDITQPFTLSPATTTGANYVTSANYLIINGVPTQIQFEWLNAIGLSTANVNVAFSLDYAPTTTEAHYATLHLFDPYGQTQLSYQSGDLGPSTNFSSNLVGATGNDPTSGMTITGIGLSNPTYVYQASSTSPDSITIYSPQAMSPINTNILTFSNFYPTDASGKPLGDWNAYAAFFHTGLKGETAPTVDGKGYAFAFDDNGGYSSDITVQLPSSSAAGVVTTLNLTLLPWLSKAKAT